MKDKLNQTIEGILHERQTRRRYAAILLVLALITVLSVNWSLHQKGLSLTADAYAQETVDATAETALDADDTQENTDAAAQAAPATLQLDDAQYAIAVQADGAIDMVVVGDHNYVTGLSGDGTKYDAEKNMYSTNLGMDFSFPKGTVKSDSLHYYYDYPAGIIVPSNLLDTDHPLLDASGVTAGTYKFVKNADGTYRVYVDFDPKYATEHSESAISGNISFQGHASASSDDENGNIHLVGKDNVKLDIPKDEIKYPDNSTNLYDITTNKSGSYSVKDGKLTYTVTVDSVKGTPDVVHFTDKIDANGLTLGDPKVTVAKKTITRYYYGTEGNYNYDAPKDAGTVTVNDLVYNNGELTMTLPKMETVISATDNEGRYNMTYTRYEITYTYDVIDLPAGTTTAVNNEVTTASSNNTTDIKHTATAEVTVSNKYEVEKSGMPNIGQGFIVWNITVNKNGLDITGAKLTDDMLQNLLVNDQGHEEFTIRPEYGYTIHKDDSGKITDITFDAVNGDPNNNTYTISYRTPVQGNWNGTATVTNEAHLTNKDGDKLADGTATVEIDKGSLVSKTAAGAEESPDGNTVAVNWKVKVTAPLNGIPNGVTITDTLTGAENAPHYRTRQQAIEWAQNIYWVDARGQQVDEKLSLVDGGLADVTFKASDGNTYTWQQISEGDAETFDNLTFTDCNVTLKAKLKPPEGAAYLVFDYWTTANVKDAPVGSNTFYNHFDIGGKKADAYYEYKKDGITKTDEDGNTGETSKINETGTLIWKINANLSKATNTLEITDELPEGVTLVSVSGEGGISQLTPLTPGTDGKLTGTAGSYTVSGSYTDNKLYLTIQHKDAGGKLDANNTYTLVVKCKVDKNKIDGYVAGKPYTFTNKATAKINNSSISSASQTQEWTEDTDHSNAKIVDKTGAWDNSTRRFKYSIKLNPYGKDLVKDSDVLELTDVFTYYSKFYAYVTDTVNLDGIYNATAWLVPNTVKLYKAKMVNGELEKGEEITNWTWTVTTRDDSNDKKISTLTGKDLPDSTPMILEYEYQMQTDMPKDHYATMQVSNEASLKGVDDKGTYIPSNVQWRDQDTSGNVTSDMQGVLYKVAKGNYGKLLPGAVFTLQKYENGSYTDIGTTYTTDADGRIVIQWQKTASDVQYEQNTLYRVVETTPPNGYKLPSNAVSKAFYFYFSKDDTFTVPSGWPTSAIDLRTNSTVVYVENESAALTINKTWLDSAGNPDATHASGSVQVDVYRLATTSPSGGETASLSGEIKSFGWNQVFAFPNGKIEAQDYPVGTEISFTIVSFSGAPEIKVNNVVLEPKVTSGDKGTSYVYTYTLNSGENVISGTIPVEMGDSSFSGITAKKPDTSTGGDSGSSEPTGGEYYKTYTITADDNWTLTLTDLPATDTDDDGNTVYYTYYVQEVNPGNYTPGYENNGGISSGTITITNQASDNPGYELPSTGGPGTTLFTTGGLALMGIALLYGYWEIRKKKREVKHPL